MFIKLTKSPVESSKSSTGISGKLKEEVVLNLNMNMVTMMISQECCQNSSKYLKHWPTKKPEVVDFNQYLFVVQLQKEGLNTAVLV